jgi:type II secretory ATPase GspE/PulE/Tfp pilus assembly ATPase PilB-like protein
MDVGERRMGQSGRIPGRALGIGDSVNLRLQVNPSYLGDSVEDDNQPETLAVRILRQSGQQSYDLYRLGFPKDVLRSLEYIVSQPQGIILVTGPTGSGKTTTLYSILTHLNTPDVNIFTIEDPPEAVIEGITQIPVNLKKKQTFNSILVDLLRSDPDIIMVGEMREAIALMTSLNGSNTGHLILTTLHTNSAVDSVSRCTSMLQAVGTDVNVYRNMLGSSVIGIYAQRLVKQICPDCRESYLGNEDIAKALGIDPSLIEREVQLYRPPTYDKPRKPVDQCQTCKDAGWIGVMPIVELWIPQSDSESDDKAYISSGDFTSQQFFDIAKKRGMRTLAGHGILAAMDGSTSLKEIASKIGGLRDQKDLLVVAINNYDPNWKE